MKMRQVILFCLGAILLISGGLPERQRRDHHDHGEATAQRHAAPEAEMTVPDGHDIAEEDAAPASVDTGSADMRYHPSSAPRAVRSKQGRKKRHSGWALGLGALFSLGALTAAGRHKARKRGRKRRHPSGEPRFPDWFAITIGILAGAAIAFGSFLLAAIVLGAFPGFGMMALALLAAVAVSAALATGVGFLIYAIDPPGGSGLKGCGERFAFGLLIIALIIPLSLLLGGLVVPIFLEHIALILVSFWTGLGIWLICGAGLILAYFIGVWVWTSMDYAEKPEPGEGTEEAPIPD